MSSVSRTSTRACTSVGGGCRAAVWTTDELKSRRYAGDFSHLLCIIPKSGHPPPLDDNDALQRIPSSSTGLLDDEAVSVFTSSSGNLTTSPIEDRVQLPPPSPDAHEQTDAQRIAALYRQRCFSSPDGTTTTTTEPNTPNVSSNLLNPSMPSYSSIVMRSGVCTWLSLDAVIGV